METKAYDMKKLSTANMEDLQEFIFDLVEYLEDRMDADYEDGHHIPNDELKMLGELNKIFGISPY